MLKLFTVFLISAILAVSACAIACAADSTTWPQSFNLYAGQNVQYTFEVSTAGQIVIDSTWTWCGLIFALADPSGKIVNGPVSAKPSPVHFAYTVTAADLQKGKQWKLTIGTPPASHPSQKPVAEGSVTVNVPVALMLPNLRRPGVLSASNIVVPPSIESVTPNSGGPGDYVFVKGRSIPDDKSQAEVWFTLSGSITRQGTIVSATKSQGVVTYDVLAPARDGVQNVFAGPLYVKLKGTTTVTNSRTFNYMPFPPPTITGHAPQYGFPGRMTTFSGTHFQPADSVYFAVAGRGDISSPSVSYHSSTEITAIVPPDVANSKLITVYVRGPMGNGWQNGPRYEFPLDPAAVSSKPK